MPRKVLVADDDKLLVALIQETLEEAGYQVLPAFDGMEVLDHVRREAPDCIVLDLVLPKLDGAQVCHHLKEDPRLRSIPIIVLTGTVPEDPQWLRGVGADAYIVKREAEAILQDLFPTLQAFEERTAPPAWAQEIRDPGEIRPRTIVTELLAHTTHLNALLQNLGEGILFLDPTHRVLYVNPAGATLLRRHERELVGATLPTILGAGDDDPLLQALRVLASREGLATERLVYTYREHTFYITIANLLGEGWATGQLLLIRDVSPLFRRIRELAALNELAALLASTLDLDVLLRLIMEQIQDLMDVEACSLLLKGDKKDELVFRIGLGEHGEAVQGQRLKVGEGIAGWVFQQGSPLIVPDARQDRRFYRRVDYDTGFTTKSVLCVPLKTRDKVIGVIQVLNPLTTPAFNQDDLNLLSAIAAHAATAIENARLYTEMKFYAEELDRKIEERTQEVEAANARLEEALHRAEEASNYKSAFLATVINELRTSLKAIIGFSEPLEDQKFGPLNDKQAHHISNILVSGRHLLAVINDILDLSELEAGRVDFYPQSFALGDALNAAISETRSQAVAKGLTVNLHVEEGLSTIVADPLRFKQILSHLLANAMKFTPNGGRVTVTARLLPPERVEIAVQDTGIGIEAEDLPKLFQPFTRLDTSFARRSEGTGLGLALTKRLVEMHGGEIRAESDGKGKGSTFTLTLPLAHGRDCLQAAE